MTYEALMDANYASIIGNFGPDLLLLNRRDHDWLRGLAFPEDEKARLTMIHGCQVEIDDRQQTPGYASRWWKGRRA